MLKVIKRTSIVIVVIAFAMLLFAFLVYFGDKSKGPLEDVARSVDNGVARFEKKMIGGNMRESRSGELKWFNNYRNSKTRLNYPDTIFMGAYDNNSSESYESIVTLEDSLKNKLPIVQFYTAWGSKKEQVFPMLRAQAIYDLGSIPMITWEPWLNDFDREKYPLSTSLDDVNRGGMKDVAGGKYDEYIDKWAADAKTYHAPFFLRFGHEMNDPYRYPWGPQYNKPEDFIAAWRHVVDRFRKTGADNAIWIWAPHSAYPTYELYYPGNNYIDWIGTGALNYGTVATWSKWYSFKETISGFYSKVSLYGKPVMITEFGSLEVGGDRAAWFEQALDSLPYFYPKIKSVVFFNNSNDNTTSYKVLNWSVTRDESSLIAIRQSFANWRMSRDNQ